MKFGNCTNFDTRKAVIKSKFQKFQNLTPLVASQSPGTKKGSKANNFTNNWNKKLKFDTCTNFDTRNTVMKPKYQKIQNLTPLVTSQSPGPKKGQKQITSQIIEIKSWNLATNFDKRNAVTKFQKFQNLTPLLTSQSPGTKKVTSQIIEIKSWNLTLALILTRGIQWWSPNIKKFKIWPR